jgi:hypothetical protein
MRHWHPYLCGREFTVCTDHFSLKYLLDQRLSSITQHQWASKFLGFDFKVEFKPGAMNIITDALSRRNTTDDDELLALSTPTFALFDELRALRNEVVAGMVSRCEARSMFRHPPQACRTSWQVPMASGMKEPRRHYTGFVQTFTFPTRAGRYWTSSRRAPLANATKWNNSIRVGLLQPLELPSAVWADVAMDFIKGFPQVHGKSIILTIVDRFSMKLHFLLGHLYTATLVARVLFDSVVRLHGIPSSIVSDKDLVFTSQFWRELFSLSGVKLNMLSAFHPQSDGQLGATNKRAMGN